MLERAVFSERAMIALLSETQEHIKTETGGVFLGHRCGNNWYIVEAIDPGINCVFKPAYFEYDDVYLNHLMNKIDRLYKRPMDIIGLWHRHPGSFDQFSGTDDETNIKYARRHPEGAISALVNIDPNFRVTMYHVANPLAYRKVEYIVGDSFFPPEFLTYASSQKYLNQINQPNPTGSGVFSWFKKIDTFIGGKDTSELFPKEYTAKKFSFSNILHEYLKDKTIKEKFEVAHIDAGALSDDELDSVLEYIQTDLDYFEETGINVTLSMRPSGGLDLKENTHMANFAPILITMFVNGGKVYFNYNKRTFKYSSGMFKDACESHILPGGRVS